MHQGFDEGEAVTSDQLRIIAANREKCERVLLRCVGSRGGELDYLATLNLNDTPFEALSALVRAYRKIEEMEGGK